jgi:MlaD protein
MLKSAVMLLVAAVLTSLAGCAAAAPSRFTTQLDKTGGIGPGDPVTHAGATIGQVTGVAPISGGDSEIGFQVDHPHAGEIREDTIMVLVSDGAPSLEAFNAEAMSPAAPSGFPLDGASSQTEVQLFLIANGGPGNYGQMLANFLKPLSAPSAPPAPPSPAEAQMQSLMNQLTQRTMAAAAASSPASYAQLDQMRRESEGVVRQLRRNGKSAEADRLQQQVDATLSGVGAAPNTLTVPRSNPPVP